MRRFNIFFSLLLLSVNVFSQELNCKVVVSAERITSSNEQVFKTLETSITEFINQTKWTDKSYKPQERIDCSMVLTIVEESSSNTYSGSIQVQSSRPVYNSIYTTSLLNHKDKFLQFSYTEHQPLVFDAMTYQSELISILSYYVYLILAVDADSFELNGGDKYYETCRTITNQVENPNSKEGWQSNTSKVNRYHLLDKITSSSNAAFRKTLYKYHIKGLDLMQSNKKQAKQTILSAIISLKSIARNNMSSILFRMFIDAKSDEIVSIFSDGPHTDTVNLKNVLNRISPTNAHKWSKIK